ncbi:MAG: transglycosylase SLT domain-containing protein [Bdellovibrionales bacterium]|nr:transglycosylase SLT domain-containing protein [Bdellovibrionales bacterium]
MKNIYLICSSLLFFLCACSLFKKTDDKWSLPPSFTQEPLLFSTNKPEEIQEQLISIAKKYSSKAIDWWVLYKKALLARDKDLDFFCHHIQFLSQIQSFPLKYNAQLNLYSYCHKKIPINLSDFPDWLKKQATKEWYKKAKKFKNEKELMEAAFYMYELSKEKYLREQYLITAIKIAKNTKDPRLKEWQKNLYTLSPRYISSPSQKQKLSVAHDFRQARQFKKAAFYYRQFLNSPKSSFHEKNESFKWMRWIYKMQRNNKRYLIATVQWKNWLKRKMKTNKRAIYTYHNIFYLLARTQWTLNQNKKALATLHQIEKELKGQFSLFKIYRMKALIFYEQEQWKKSISFFEKALKEKHPDQETYEKTKWSYAWILKKTGKRKESIEVWKELLDTSESEYLPSRVLFWMGHTYEDIKDLQTANEKYKQLIEKDPLSYYGLLAHYKLNKKIYIDKKKTFFQQESQSDYTVAQWLISLDEYDSALDFLQYKAEQYQKDKNKDMKKGATLFYYMAKARFYFPLFKMVGKLPLEDRTVFFRSYTELIFPTIYTKEVEKAAQLFNIEKEWIYALIRQESAWNPRARSPADAFGLMQIRPFVARKVAKKHGISYKNIYDLYNPGKNILLGTAFLKKLFHTYDSQFVITVAVYNAGRTAVMNWIKNIPITDPLSFIEEIPYEETRTYVRLLIRNFIFYKLLNSPERKLMFPEWLLHIKKSSSAQYKQKGSL